MRMMDAIGLARLIEIEGYDKAAEIYNGYDNDENFSKLYNESNSCKNCTNNPRNGGSGICNCTLGSPKVTC